MKINDLTRQRIKSWETGPDDPLKYVKLITFNGNIDASSFESCSYPEFMHLEIHQLKDIQSLNRVDLRKNINIDLPYVAYTDDSGKIVRFAYEQGYIDKPEYKKYFDGSRAEAPETKIPVHIFEIEMDFSNL